MVRIGTSSDGRSRIGSRGSQSAAATGARYRCVWIDDA